MRRTRSYRSGLEKKIINDLEKKGVNYEYEPRTFDFPQRVRRGECGECHGKTVFQIRRYIPDLYIRDHDFWIEVKGKFTGEARARMECFLERHRRNESRADGIELKFIFQRDNWITKKHKAKYSDWCKKLGLDFHIGEEVPEKWLSSPTV